jgi:serine/threonine-protein kinase
MPVIVPGQRVAKWTILRLLAQGGQGAVYEALWEDIGQRGAFKVLHAQQMTAAMQHRFRNELRAVSAIEHPSIPQVLDYDVFPDGTAYGVMQFIEGETLEARMSKRKLSLQEALAIAEMAASALAAAHAKNIIHRDIKPGNIMIKAEDGQPLGERAMVLDFGIAKVSEGVAVTATGNLVGTPIYMAYEQGVRAQDVDGRADVYSLGVVLYQMLCRRLPFPYSKNDPMFVVLSSKLEDSTPIEKYAPNLPGELRALVNAMVQKDRTRRPSMADVRATLRTIQGLAPAKQTGSHVALGLPSPITEAVDGPLDFDDDNDPTGSAAANAASAQPIVLTPSEMKIKGEVSPSAISVPQSVSDVVTRPQRLPPVLSGPSDRTAQPAPTMGIPDALASPIALTEPEKPKQPASPRSHADAPRKLSLIAAAIGTLGLAATAAVLMWPRPAARQAVTSPSAAATPPTVSAPPATPQPAVAKSASDAVLPETASKPNSHKSEKGSSSDRKSTPSKGKHCDFPKPSCVSGFNLTKEQKEDISTAIREAHIKTCASESLVFTIKNGKLVFAVNPDWLPLDAQRDLLISLKSLIKTARITGGFGVSCDK